jgi:putative ABC transport system permease protein
MRQLFDIPQLGQTLRSLRRAPSFTIPATVTLAVGTGAMAAIFSIVNAVLLRPLPFFQSDHLVAVRHTLPGLGVAEVNQSPGSYFHYRRTSRQLASIAGYTASPVNLSGTDDTGAPEYVRAARISANLLGTLGVAPPVGRGFVEADDRPNGEHVALISDALWRRRFGADPRILGATLQIDGMAYRVVGVLAAGFHFPDPTTELWLPLALDPAMPIAGGFNEMAAVARLGPGVSLAGAQEELNQVLARLPEAYPNLAPGMPTTSFLAQARARVIVRPLRDETVGGFARILWVVATTAALVLVVTCANVATLLLVRTLARRHELAVHVALGCSGGRLFARSMAETLVIAGLGGAGGLLLAWITIRLLVSVDPSDIPRLHEISVDGHVLAFTALVSIGVALVCSAIPVMRYGTTDLAPALQGAGRSATATRERSVAQRALITVQVALALVVLAGSGLLLRTVWQLRAVRTGFDPQNTLVLSLSLPNSQFPNRADVARFYDELVQRVRVVTGVEEAGVVSKLPLMGRASHSPVYVERMPAEKGVIPPVHAIQVASAGYFRAIRIPLLAGRLFGSPTDAATAHEVVVSRAFADYYWHDETGRRVVGERVRVAPNEPWYTIVGVVESVRDTAIAAPPIGTVYFPMVVPAAGSPDSAVLRIPRVMTLVVRSARDPVALTNAIRGEIRALDPTLPIFAVYPMGEVVARSTARTTFLLLALAGAALITLVLAAVGLYGVMAYVVSLRTPEIALRLAVGAEPARVRRLVLREGMGLTVVGLAAGVVVFAVCARVLRAVLFEVSPGDPITLLIACSLLLVVAALASWLPARRAARVDPLGALRGES